MSNADAHEKDDEPIPPDVLAWCQNLVRILNDGGTWGIPRSGIVFTIDKPNKRLVLTLGHESNEDFIATKHVFAKIGWSVVAKETPPAK